jgi:hypothetical protein
MKTFFLFLPEIIFLGQLIFFLLKNSLWIFFKKTSSVSVNLLSYYAISDLLKSLYFLLFFYLCNYPG